MTIEERFDRTERISAGLAEERPKDREEFRQRWRDGQQQINELATRMNDVTIKVATLTARSRAWPGDGELKKSF